MFDGEVEADESYFGGQRKGKRGRGAAGKVAVFRLLKRNGKVSFAVRYVRFVTFEDFLNPARRFGFRTPLLDKGGKIRSGCRLPAVRRRVRHHAGNRLFHPLLIFHGANPQKRAKKNPVTCRK